MTAAPVYLEDRGAYAVITLNQPGTRNAMGAAVQEQLREILRDCLGRYAAVVLTGKGEVFCLGIDQEEARAEYSRQGNGWIETIESIRRHPAVFIAAVNGDALGGGVSLINVCDLAICGEGVQIGMPEVNSASYPTVAGPTTQLRILRKHAAWMILTGKPVSGLTAARWGLVNRAVPADQVMPEAEALAGHIAGFNPVTLDYSKKALDDIPSQVSDWTAALEYGRVITSVIQNKIGKENVTPKKF